MEAVMNPQKKRILVVEDEKVTAFMEQQVLINLGYNVPVVASSGDEAIQLARESRPDLILMDIDLAGRMDGIDTASRIKTEMNLPIVFLTGHSGTDVLARATLSNPAAYLIKPFDAHELRSTIEVSLNQHDLECRLREHEQWLAAVLSSVGDAVVAVDSLGDVQWMNPSSEKLFGSPAAGCRGCQFESVVRFASVPAHGMFGEFSGLDRVEQLLDEVLSGQRPSVQVSAIEIEGGDGALIPVELTISCIDVGHNTICGAVLVLRRLS
jgi:CheY-like chemotaxis protein